MVNVLKNYEAFYTMLSATVIMSNTPSGTFKADCDKIIELIGDAYGLDNKLILDCKQLIYKSLAPISLLADKNAIFSGRRYGDELNDEDVLFDIKCDVISGFERMAKAKVPCINPDWFDYRHYFSYNSFVRFKELLQSAAAGNVVLNRQVAILLALGIGCEADLEESYNRLLCGALWGDIPSIRLLARIAGLKGERKKAKIFKETAELADKYLFAGHTLVPEKDKANYSEEAVIYYIYISSILQDIVFANKIEDIDYSFIEALRCENLDYYKRMYFINNYERKEWKDITNSAENPSKKIGFR